MSCGKPPASAMRFNFSFAKKAIERPSGDQNGPDAPSVPSIKRGSTVAKFRTHSCATPLVLIATNTSREPSGDSAMSAVPRGSDVPAAG